MRIDALYQVSQVYKTNKTQKGTDIVSAKGRDEVQISSLGYDYQIAKKAVAETSDVREEVVNSMKESIASGTYEISGGQLAEKLFFK